MALESDLGLEVLEELGLDGEQPDSDQEMAEAEESPSKRGSKRGREPSESAGSKGQGKGRGSLREAVEALLRRQHWSWKKGPSRNPRCEDPAQLGCLVREQGWWPRLKHYVSIITATKAVGPTHGLTVYINTKYSDVMGDIPGGQDSAASALSRSLGILVTVFPPCLRP